MLTRASLIEEWSRRRDELRLLKASVDGATLIDKFLGEFRDLVANEEDITLSLTEAAEYSGYSRRQLGRLVRENKIPNAGRRNAPRIRIKNIPLKATALPNRTNTSMVIGRKAQIAWSVVHPQRSNDG
jgi:hypothetical protein